MSTKSGHNVNQILKRLKVIVGVKTDSDLAAEMGVTPSSLSKMRSRGSLNDSRIVSLCIREDASLDWIYAIDPETPSGPESYYVERVAELEKELRQTQSERDEVRGRLDELRRTLDQLGADRKNDHGPEK